MARKTAQVVRAELWPDRQGGRVEFVTDPKRLPCVPMLLEMLIEAQKKKPKLQRDRVFAYTPVGAHSAYLDKLMFTFSTYCETTKPEGWLRIGIDDKHNFFVVARAETGTVSLEGRVTAQPCNADHGLHPVR